MIITPLSVGAFQTNCYIVQDDNSTFLIDAPAPGEVIINKLKQNKLILDLLILTHGHFDHVLGIKELKNEFPNLKNLSIQEGFRFCELAFVIKNGIIQSYNLYYKPL